MKDKEKMKKFLLVIWVFLIFGVSFAQTNYYVDNNLGSDKAGQGSGSGTAAWKTIEYALNHVENPTVDSIIIYIANGTYNLSNNPIDISRGFLNVSVVGENSDSTIVEANSDITSGASRIFQIHAGNNVKLSNLTVQYGHSDSYGCAISNDSSYLMIQHCLITQNFGGAIGYGGAVSNINGTCIIKNSTISYNIEGDSSYGGGVCSLNGDCEIINSTIAYNNAAGGGGIAICSYGDNATFSITNSTISENTASYFCGGIRISKFDSTNFTITGTISNSTIFHNVSTGKYGMGGIGILSNVQLGPHVTIKNTIIAGNVAASKSDISGNIISGDYNLIQDTLGAVISGNTTNNIYGVSPMCSTLALNNSLNGTMTCAISANSPARDVIPSNSPNGSPLYDQRGAPRNGNYDIGAYEYWNGMFPLAVIQNRALSPGTFELLQNYPNPFNPSTIIKYNIVKAGYIELSVYNILGQKVAVLVNGFKNAGSHATEFNAASLSSGIYFYTLREGSNLLTRKMVLLK